MKKQRSYSIFVVEPHKETLALFKNYLKETPHLTHFCSTVADAKSIMAGVSPDVFICNYLVNGSGAHEAMDYVKSKHINAIRVLYSAEQNKLDMMKIVASGQAHRYFCLPWDKNGVGKILNNDLLTRSRLRAHNCWNFLEKENNGIPMLPQILSEISDALHDPNFSLEKIAAIIEKDPAITLKLMKLVNSAAFPKQREIGDVLHAVTYLGAGLVRELILFICVKEAMPASPQCINQAKFIANHSYQCSRMALHISRDLLPGLEKSTVTAALLHDIGKLFFFAYSCDAYVESLSMLEAFDMTSTDFEKEVFGVSHTELGSSLMLWWNLPMNLIETAANHNLPLNKLTGIPKCVAISDRLLLEQQFNGELTTDLDTLNTSKYPLEKWRQKAAQIIQNDHSPFE